MLESLLILIANSFALSTAQKTEQRSIFYICMYNLYWYIHNFEIAEHYHTIKALQRYFAKAK